jgi:hypothetical protein
MENPMNAHIRIGIVGADTSHVTAFTKLINDASDPAHVPGGKVVACVPTFSPDWDKSFSRVEGFKKDLQEKYNVQLIDAIPAMLKQVDAVLLESVDGRRHLAELKQVVKAKCPVYIDKPFAASLKDAKAMVKLLQKKGIPAWSSSGLRFEANLEKWLGEPHGRITGATTWGPAAIEAQQPGWYWYGIHAVEELYRIMGPGCKRVRCAGSAQGDVATGEWADGRIGVVRGNRAGQSEFGAVIHCDDQIACIPRNKDVPLYAALVRNIMKFFQTRQAPVPLEETLEIMAFIEAANKSAATNGRPVELNTKL